MKKCEVEEKGEDKIGKDKFGKTYNVFLAKIYIEIYFYYILLGKI